MSFSLLVWKYSGSVDMSQSKVSFTAVQFSKEYSGARLLTTTVIERFIKRCFHEQVEDGDCCHGPPRGCRSRHCRSARETFRSRSRSPPTEQRHQESSSTKDLRTSESIKCEVFKYF